MPTMAEIAKRAGVALSTVSYALSGKRPVSEEAKKRIQQAIKDLEYQPNTLARALATKKTKIIALLYPSSVSGLSAPQIEFLTSVAETATRKGYATLLWTSLHEDQEILHMTQQGFIDGVLLMEIALHDPRVAMLKARHYPFTMIGHGTDNDGLSFVDLDFHSALQTSVEYLLTLGHTNIALMTHSLTLLHKEIGHIVRTKEGFAKVMHAHQLQDITCSSESSEEAGYLATKTLLAEHPTLSALILTDPWVSGGVLRALSERNLKVPDHFSLLAITSPRLAEMTTPTLTSVDFPYVEMGRIGVEMLIHTLEGQQKKPQQLLLKPALTVRRSTGPHTRN